MGRAAAPNFRLLHTLVLPKALGTPASWWLTKGAALLGLAVYARARYDLVPDMIPVWDQVIIAFLLLVGARAAMPGDDYGGALGWAERPTAGQHWQFVLRTLRSDLANFFLYQYRGVDGFLVTGKNSGTHWLKFMLSCALAQQYRLPPPRYASGEAADEIFGDLRRPRSSPHLPRIGSSHTVPSVICSWSWVIRVLPYPPVVVLVRDIQDAMASHYVKWRHQVPGPFSRYVRGDPAGQCYKADIWWYIRFFNRWGDLAQANPGKVLVVRYEDLQADPAACLRRIAAHWRIHLDEAAFAEALRFTGRGAIRSLLDPADTEMVVPSDGTTSSVVYTRADEAFLRATTARYLRHDFGYGYLRPVRHGSRSAGLATSSDAAPLP